MHYYKRKDAKRQRNEEINTVFWGWIIMGLTLLSLSAFLFTAFISKWIPETGSPFLDWLKHDQYYSYLWVIIVFPVSILFVYMNWLCLKVFRHN
jgi:hypothetical protein